MKYCPKCGNLIDGKLECSCGWSADEVIISGNIPTNIGNIDYSIGNQFFNPEPLVLYTPIASDYWYEEKLLSDSLTMSYNAGYDVTYEGYHYDTGCIDFPKDKWTDKYNERKNNNYYFAYIKDNNINEFIGTVNYHYSNDRYECGIVIEYKYRGKGYSTKALNLLCEHAKSNGIKELYDCFEIDRDNTLDIFKKVGFEVVEETTYKKFGKEVKGVVVKKVL